jgi:hypothetical protein
MFNSSGNEIYQNKWLFKANDLRSIIIYVFLAIIIILIIVTCYIKIKFRFWSIQPVFHIYDFYWYIFPCGIIRHELPERNRYCNFKEIETLTNINNESFKLTRFINFIQRNYLQNRENKYLPEKENILPYFTGHNSSCLFSFYTKKELLLNSNDESIEDNKIISVMTSRPLHVFINNGNKDASFDVYYVDYLCVDKDYRKQGIAPEIIQTHEYNQSIMNKKIKISLFKREDELTGIVPLCVYKTYGFSMEKWIKPPVLPIYLGLVEVGPSNIHHLIDFIKSNQIKFDILIIMEVSNLIELLKTKNIYCYIIIEDGEIICAYFFRKTCTFIKFGCEALNCFASINCSKNLDVFVEGYKIALWKICRKNKTFKYAIIENISDNLLIIKNIMIKTIPIVISPTAFFFYNFAYSSFKSEKTLIIY